MAIKRHASSRVALATQLLLPTAPVTLTSARNPREEKQHVYYMIFPLSAQNLPRLSKPSPVSQNQAAPLETTGGECCKHLLQHGTGAQGGAPRPCLQEELTAFPGIATSDGCCPEALTAAPGHRAMRSRPRRSGLARGSPPRRPTGARRHSIRSGVGCLRRAAAKVDVFGGESDAECAIDDDAAF